jgi:hypothetical protein
VEIIQDTPEVNSRLKECHSIRDTGCSWFNIVCMQKAGMFHVEATNQICVAPAHDIGSDLSSSKRAFSSTDPFLLS